jgi:hypothetical protein
MIDLRSRIKLIALFSIIFFATSIGSIQGLVLCYGSDGHIHTEITFNGVDCGHFPATASGQTTPDYLIKFNHSPHTNHCIACVDIPLSVDYSLKKFNNTTTRKSASKLLTTILLPLSASSNSPIIHATHLPENHLEPISPALHLIQNTILLL